MREDNPDIEQFECSVFNGVYITHDVDQAYLDYLQSLRGDDTKALNHQQQAEDLALYNEG